MAYRAKGRMIIDKVGQDGKKIKGSLATWKRANPGKLVFDSMPEYQVWECIQDLNLAHVYQPSILLYDKMKTEEFKDGQIKEITQRTINYTPDFYLSDFKVYIEVKGYADDLFKLRWKLFKLNGYKGFIVYSLQEFKTLVKRLEERQKKATKQ